MYLSPEAMTQVIKQVDNIRSISLDYKRITIETMTNETIEITIGKTDMGSNRLWYWKEDK